MVSGADVWHTRGLAEYGVPSVLLSDGPHGLRTQTSSADHLGAGGSVPATCFPPAVTLASSWDLDLLRQVGAAVGAEARSQGVAVVLGPGVNIKRHPFCGRNFEYFSEDPLLAGRLGAAMVAGIQSAGVGACVKHFAVNNQEANRLVVDAVVDERTLREIYLAGFETVVRRARPWAVMAAYNRVNGEYCCDSRRLLTSILRDAWGFDGLVVSDWGATNERAAGVAAGMDLEMPGSAGLSDGEVAAAIRAGRVAESDLDTSVRRVIDVARRAPRQTIEADLTAHHQLARKAAAQSAVLLTNDGLLPLAGRGSLAVIGAFARHPRFQGAGSSLVNPTRVETLWDAVQQREGLSVTYAPGYDPVAATPDAQLIADAAQTAVGADSVVLMVGLPGAYESEGFDRTRLGLPDQHERLIEAVCAANPHTVVVLSNGSPVAMPWVQRPAAILEAYLGGQASGSGLADVLFGEEEPSGRLAETFPLAVTDVPSDAYFPGHPRQVEYREGIYVGYRYFDTAEAAVRFPFGHGLSYTTFDFGPAHVTPQEVAVTVTNTGTRRGAEVVQVYVAASAGTVHRPAQELAGFAKVWLDPGESQKVQVPIDDRTFAVYDVASADWCTEAGDYQVRVGASSRDIRCTAAIQVDARGEPSPSVAPPGLVARGDDEFTALLGRPIPTPPSTRPFTRTSPLGDLQATTTGRMVRRIVLRFIAPGIRQIAAGDPAMEALLLRSAQEAPLRAIAQFSDGKVSWELLDGLLDVLNARPGAAADRARRAVLARRGRRG